MTRKEASLLGLVRFIGKTCPRGHSERYARSGKCCECEKAGKKSPRARETAKLYSRMQRRKDSHRIRAKGYRHAKPAAILVREAKKRARLKGLTFALKTADLSIPSHCPVLGIPLTVGAGVIHDGSPTIDRLNCAEGYVPNNVAVISYKANRMKNNGTLREIEALAKWMREVGCD